MNNNYYISFVIPCYRSEKSIEQVVDEIFLRMEKYDNKFEVILVNDNSPDNVWRVINGICEKHKNVIAVNLAKNFGQHAALLAGYSKSRGDIVISLDDDGQAPLESLEDLINKIEEGYDVVYAYYKEVKQNLFRRMGSNVAKKMNEVMLGAPKDFKGSSFYVAKRFVIDEMLKYDNSYPYLLGLVLRTTRNIAWVETEHRSRLYGRSGYNFKSLLSLWVNGFTAFSVKPLELSTYIGFLMALIGFVYAIYVIIRKILVVDLAVGWSSVISIMLITSGMILMILGIIGEYIGRIYICINKSPQYVIKEIIDLRKEDKKD